MEVRRYDLVVDDSTVRGVVGAGYASDPELGEVVGPLFGPDRERPQWRRCQLLPRLSRETGILAVEDGRQVGLGSLADFGGSALVVLCGVHPDRPDAAPLTAAILARLLTTAAALGRTLRIEIPDHDRALVAALAGLPAQHASFRHVVQDESRPQPPND